MAFLRGLLIHGLLVTVPILVTFALLRWVFRVLDSILQPALRLLLGNALPKAGLAGGFGHRALAALERVLFRTPLLRTIYGARNGWWRWSWGGPQAPFRRVVRGLEIGVDEALTLVVSGLASSAQAVVQALAVDRGNTGGVRDGQDG
jgi:uncharacterized membrane protein